jgi:conjugative transposon TraK protein
MMFKKMKNIESAFQHVRSFSIIVIVACLVITCYAVFKSYLYASQSQSKLYILANGKVLDAYASERKDNVPVEAKDHISMFHRYFFTLDPDEKVIISNITRALYLADASAKSLYESLKESSYYSNIISSNISQQITVDSIRVNVESYPYYFRFYGTEKIIRATSIVTRSLVTEGYLRNVSRSDNNPHGFLIERFFTIDNRDLQIQNR